MKIVKLNDIIGDTIKEIKSGKAKGGIMGIKTDFRNLDLMINGLGGGKLVIVAGRPSMGKTALTQNIAINVAKREKKVIIFNTEATPIDCVKRMMAIETNVDHSLIRAGLVKDKFYNNVEKLKKLPLYFYDSAYVTIKAINKIVDSEKPDLIIIDFLTQMADYDASNGNVSIGIITQGLKMLAMEKNIPIILVSQLNRQVESRKPPIPRLFDLRESGKLEEAGDVIIFVYREYYYNKSTPDPNKVVLIIAKQRDGAVGDIILKFTPEYLKFSEVNKGE